MHHDRGGAVVDARTADSIDVADTASDEQFFILEMQKPTIKTFLPVLFTTVPSVPLRKSWRLFRCRNG